MMGVSRTRDQYDYPLYDIKFADSEKFCIDWTQNGKFTTKIVTFVFIENNIFKMYYSYEKSW